MKIPQINTEIIKLNKDAADFLTKSGFDKLPQNPDLGLFKNPSSLIYFILKSSSKSLLEWYKHLFKIDIDLNSASDDSGIIRSKELDRGYIIHNVMYATLVAYLSNVKFDKSDIESKIDRVKVVDVKSLAKTFKYGDRSNTINKYGDVDVIISRSINSEIKQKELKKQVDWSSVLKEAIKCGYSRKLCEQYKDKYINGNKGIFMMALSNHKE